MLASHEVAVRRLKFAIDPNFEPLEEVLAKAEEKKSPRYRLAQAIIEAKAQATPNTPSATQEPFSVYRKGDIEIIWSNVGDAPLSLSYDDQVDSGSDLFTGRTTVTFGEEIIADLAPTSGDERIFLYTDDDYLNGLTDIVRDAGPFELQHQVEITADKPEAVIVYQSQPQAA